MDKLDLGIIDTGLPTTGEMSTRDLQIAFNLLCRELSFRLRHQDARNFTQEGARSVVALGTQEGE